MLIPPLYVRKNLSETKSAYIQIREEIENFKTILNALKSKPDNIFNRREILGALWLWKDKIRRMSDDVYLFHERFGVYEATQSMYLRYSLHQAFSARTAIYIRLELEHILPGVLTPALQYVKEAELYGGSRREPAQVLFGGRREGKSYKSKIVKQLLKGKSL